MPTAACHWYNIASKNVKDVSNTHMLQVPFSINCNAPSGTVPGDIRWVTTNIARFDPLVDWPPDLSCAFRWNKELKTYDGERALETLALAWVEYIAD